MTASREPSRKKAKEAQQEEVRAPRTSRAHHRIDTRMCAAIFSHLMCEMFEEK